MDMKNIDVIYDYLLHYLDWLHQDPMDVEYLIYLLDSIVIDEATIMQWIWNAWDGQRQTPIEDQYISSALDEVPYELLMQILNISDKMLIEKMERKNFTSDERYRLVEVGKWVLENKKRKEKEHAATS